MGENGKSPTIDELTLILWQKSKRWVVQYLEALEKKWFITRAKWYRSISLWKSSWFKSVLNIPILWYANAGTPVLEAKQSTYWVLPISKKIINRNEEQYFVLKVEGTSMNNYELNWKFIENWSYVLIKKDNITLNNSDAFLFIVNWCATIKKYLKNGDDVYLLPISNDDYHKPIILTDKDNIEVNWKVVNVFTFNN
jgi:SOS-response transcriptional repressor LexA